jgi:DNA-directed RNA polymerase I, II, and III subunit RPABC2
LPLLIALLVSTKTPLFVSSFADFNLSFYVLVKKEDNYDLLGEGLQEGEQTGLMEDQTGQEIYPSQMNGIDGINGIHGQDQEMQEAQPQQESSAPGPQPERLPNKERVTTPYLTKYERARILGTRALQIRSAIP